MVTLDDDCIKEKIDLVDIFIRAKGEMQNALQKEFPNGLGLPHVEIEEL